jgi:hypothetical protein
VVSRLRNTENPRTLAWMARGGTERYIEACSTPGWPPPCVPSRKWRPRVRKPRHFPPFRPRAGRAPGATDALEVRGACTLRAQQLWATCTHARRRQSPNPTFSTARYLACFRPHCGTRWRVPRGVTGRGSSVFGAAQAPSYGETAQAEGFATVLGRLGRPWRGVNGKGRLSWLGADLGCVCGGNEGRMCRL